RRDCPATPARVLTGRDRRADRPPARNSELAAAAGARPARRAARRGRAMTRQWRDPAPGEQEAGERSWKVVRAAFGERLPAPSKRDWRPLAAAAVGIAVLAAAFSPPGLAVLGSIRDAVRGEKNAKPALFSLPAKGRLLVNSAEGAWVVERNGSKRLLSGYRDASWSPHGLYLAAVNGDELRALEPNGHIHWSIGRPSIS